MEKSGKMNDAPAEVLESFKKLTDKQRAFALAMPLAQSQTGAARLAGYADKTAEKLAFKLASHPDIKKVVDYLAGKLHAPVVEDAKDSVDRMLDELCRAALADPRTMFDENGCMLPIQDWPDDIARAVSSIESFEEYQGRGDEREAIGMVRKVRFVGKTDAIDKVSKIKGYYRPERHEHTGPGGGPMQMKQVGEVLDLIDGHDTGIGAASSRKQ